jgi:hypothetical protein
MKGSLLLLDRWGQRLKVSQPELWMIRIHYVLPLGLIAVIIGVIISLTLPISQKSLPNPPKYFLILLLSSFLLSCYWALLQIRQHQLFSFHQGSYGLATMFLYLVCLLLINAPPVVMVKILFERIAALFPGEQSLEVIAQALGVNENSTEITIIGSARQLSMTAIGLDGLGLVSILFFELALITWLPRHIPFEFVARALFGLVACNSGVTLVAAFLGLKSMDSQRLWGGVFLIIYLTCLVGMLRGVIRAKLSAAVYLGTVGSIVLTPLVPYFYSLLTASNQTRISPPPLFIGIVLYVLLSWHAQWVLNRASIMGSATLCSSRWTQRCRRQFHRCQNRRKHRARLLTEKSLRSRRPIRPCEEKVVNGGEALPLAWQAESSKLMVA